MFTEEYDGQVHEKKPSGSFTLSPSGGETKDGYISGRQTWLAQD